MANEFEFVGYGPSGAVEIKKLGGTISEVLQQLADRRITAKNLISWYDDDTNAEAVITLRW